ncbi:hypothetical protein KSP39_PZI000854 [Platanthera zijinensis]|uniref:Uncharacterized protein n=1 Tax=Platanthera zijinensis TaxID=2320716 RepID=A0AAP0GFF0_9ASPA
MQYEKEMPFSHHRRYGSQPISIPFLWEQKPGTPKPDWIYEADISPAKPGSSGETPVAPIKFVISVPFQWEEKPGKPLDRNPSSPNILPESISSRNPFFINPLAAEIGAFYSDRYYPALRERSAGGDSNRNESWNSVSESDSRCDSCGSENGGVANSFVDLIFGLPNPNDDHPASCIDRRSQLAKKRKLTLGELILLSRRLSCPKNSEYVRNRRIFPQEFMKGLFACFPFGTNGPSSGEVNPKHVGL